MTSFSFLCYVFIPLLLLVTTLVVLRRNRGMKSKKVCPVCGEEDCPLSHLLFFPPQNEKLAKRDKTYRELLNELDTPSFLQEKDNPTTEERD